MSTQTDRYGEGMCVAMIERNGYHDSDFSGIFAVRDGDGFRFEHVATGSTAYGGGFVPHEDASEEVLAAYRAQREEVLGRLAAERAERQAKVPDVGKQVTIVKAVTRGKNKVEAGATGSVVWRGVNEYDSYSRIASGNRTYRVGVQIDGEDRKVFLAEENVRVAGHEDEELPINMDNVEAFLVAGWPSR